jgi:hypothetical protein
MTTVRGQSSKLVMLIQRTGCQTARERQGWVDRTHPGHPEVRLSRFDRHRVVCLRGTPGRRSPRRTRRTRLSRWRSALSRGSCARALLHRSSAAWSSHVVLPRGHAVVQRRDWLQACRIALWRGCLSSLPVSSQDGSRFGHHRATAVDDEEQDGRVVERARYCRVRRDLGCSPGGEGEDSHEPQQAVPAVGRSADADGGDGGGDKEQRGG